MVSCLRRRPSSRDRNFFQFRLTTHLVSNAVTSARVPAGTDFKVALYSIPDRGHEPNYSEFDTDPDRQILGPSVGFLTPGLFSGGTRTNTAIAPGSDAWFQVRCWETAFGSTFEEAVVSPARHGVLPLLGGSIPIKVRTGDPTAFPPTAPGSLTAAGLRSF